MKNSLEEIKVNAKKKKKLTRRKLLFRDFLYERSVCLFYLLLSMSRLGILFVLFYQLEYRVQF